VSGHERAWPLGRALGERSDRVSGLVGYLVSVYYEERAVLKYFDKLTARQRRLLEAHLRRRMEEKLPKGGLSIVYDITHACNLCCLGCGVSSRCFRPGRDRPEFLLQPATAEVLEVLRKIRDYLDVHPDKPFFLTLGGGEVFMRPDIFEVLEEAARLFGAGSVGFDTNGTVIGVEELKRAAPLVSYIGVSLDGLADYHNHWRGASSLDGAGGDGSFQQAVAFVQEALEVGWAKEKLEVTTLVTRRNLDQVPALMRLLKRLGVQQYSIHRTMMVGRFTDPAMVPSGPDYLRLLVAVLETNEELGMDVHIHHSLESMYAALFLGYDTYADDKILLPDRQSSLGIGPNCEVYFDPWCMTPPWDRLSGGSLLDDGATLEGIIHQNGGSILEAARSCCARHVRCLGCPQRCSGGSRIAAAAHYLSRNGGLSPHQVTREHLLAGLAQPDPACPLHWNGGRDDHIY
jgi:MoaA/NifB/PqqE/SkfB family radical SAM enzyme